MNFIHEQTPQNRAGGWEFNDQHLADPPRGTCDRGWQGADATLVALVAAAQLIYFDSGFPKQNAMSYH